MKAPRPPFSGSAAVVFVGMMLLSGGVLGVIATGCTEREDESVNQVYKYNVRGRVINLPSPDNPASEFTVHHEHIPDFRDKTGAIAVNREGVRGMAPMVMPFPLGPGVEVDGLEIGDMINVEFVLNWSRKPPYYVTGIEVLPEGTPLNTNLIEPEEPEASEDADGGDAPAEADPDGDG